MMADLSVSDLTPSKRALEGASGTPIRLAGGRRWLLGDGSLGNYLDEVRDRLDDAARLRGAVPMLDISNVAFALLLDNYQLDAAEATGLVAAADPDELVDAVMEALFGPLSGRRTYTSWAMSALIANGIDPASVPGSLRPHVLAQLEYSRRCIPREHYIESAEAARKIGAIRDRITPIGEPSQDGPPSDPLDVSGLDPAMVAEVISGLSPKS